MIRFIKTIVTSSFIFANILFAQYQEISEPILHMVGNAHIDVAYRWRWNETVKRVGPDTFEGVLKTMQMEPQLTFAQSQMALYEAIQLQYPDLFDRIKEKIHQGRWSVVGGQWVEPDAILPSGESLVRQFLVGMQYAQNQLDVDKLNIAWVPDSFCGQALTLPMIYSGCGMKYYVFRRGAPQDKRVFWWQSPDGSQILAYNIPIAYHIKPGRDIVTKLDQWLNLTGFKDVMLLFGEGDHGGGPRKADIDKINALKQLPDFPEMTYTTPETYLQQLESSADWPVFKGEMGIGKGEDGQTDPSKWRGSYTSQANIKKKNRDGENLLLTAERFATIGSMLQRKPLYPRVDFNEIWKLVLFNQFHDILPGTCIGDAADDALADYEYIEQEGRRLLKFGLENIGSRINTEGDGIPLVVYNPLSWKSTQVVDTHIRFIDIPKSLQITDAKGEKVIFHVKGWSEDNLTAYVSLLATNVPAVGYKLYRVFDKKTKPALSELDTNGFSVENKFYHVEWDDHGLVSIYNKILNKQLLDGRGNILQLYSEKSSSSWDLEPDEKQPIKSVEGPIIIEKNPVRVTVRWLDKSRSAFYSREMTVYAGIPRIDFTMTIDWHETDKLLKVAFPTTVDKGDAFFEQPYGVIQRPIDGTEWPAQNWIDLSQKEYGISLLNDGKYGHSIQDNQMQISVLRGARDMDPRMDEGIHAFKYALCSHANDWKSGDVTKRALEINQPLLAAQETIHNGRLPNWGARNNQFALPEQKSFFAINSDHVVLSAIKVKQGFWSPQHVVLRVFETEGRDENVKVHLPFPPKKVTETNHIEKPIKPKSRIELSNSGFQFNISHYQLRTFIVEF